MIALSLEERTAKDQSQHKKAEEYEEDHFGDISSSFSDAGESEDRSNDRYHKKDRSPFKHSTWFLVDLYLSVRSLVPHTSFSFVSWPPPAAPIPPLVGPWSGVPPFHSLSSGFFTEVPAV